MDRGRRSGRTRVIGFQIKRSWSDYSARTLRKSCQGRMNGIGYGFCLGVAVDWVKDCLSLKHGRSNLRLATAGPGSIYPKDLAFNGRSD